MGCARDIIQEISEVRQRRRFNIAMVELPMRLSALEKGLRTHDKHDIELIRYFPVALIACIEGYFRMAIQELVDSGEPYLSNAEKIIPSKKLDFSVLRAIHGKIITVGELISHAIPLSRLEHIDGVMSELIGKKFLNVLRLTTDRWAHEVRGEQLNLILTDPDIVYSDVAKTFELRHIICHEIASAYEVNYDKTSQYFESCVLFLKAVDEFIMETIYPGAPLTQSEMNKDARESLRTKQEKLNASIEVLRNCLDADEVVSFDNSQNKWQSFCDAWVEFIVGDESRGGTIWPVKYSVTKEAVLNLRLDQINKCIGDDSLM
jgi:hypothetical protein